MAITKPVEDVGEANQEDSIKADIKNLKVFLGGTKEKMSKFVKERKFKTKVKTTSLVNAAPKVSAVNTKLIKKFLRVFLIVFALTVVVVIGIRLFFMTEGDINKPGTSGATPTPVVYIPYRPSIYSDDPTIKVLEENINILERELSSASLRESLFTPPNLDFNVSF